MKTEREKMMAGELCDASDPELVLARDRARDLCQDLNATREREQDDRRRSGVTRDMRESVFAAGNPCRVIRQITEKDHG